MRPSSTPELGYLQLDVNYVHYYGYGAEYDNGASANGHRWGPLSALGNAIGKVTNLISR